MNKLPEEPPGSYSDPDDTSPPAAAMTFTSGDEIADFVTEGRLGADELRGYVVETLSRILGESNEALDWVSPSQRRLRDQRRSSTLVHRAVLLLFTLVCIFLELIVLFITVSVDDSINYRLQFRSISIVFSLLLSAVAITWIATVSRMQSFALISLVCLFGDTPMLSFFEDSGAILYIGFVTIAVRLVATIVAIIADFRERRVDFPERSYLRFMDDTITNEMAALVNNVMAKCEAKNEQHLFSEVRPMIRRAITEALEEAYEAFATKKDGSVEEMKRDGVPTIKATEDSNQPLKPEGSFVLHHDELKTTDYLHWLRANSVRDSIHNYDRLVTTVIIVVLTILVVLTVGNVAFEFWKIFANQPPLFPESLTRKYTDRDAIKAEFGTLNGARSHTGLKVHIVVVDGLRDDFMEPGASAIGDLFARSDIAPSSIRMHTRAQLPSFSVPNWMSLLSGAPPELTGVTGNLENSETAFDTMFAIAQNFNVHAGITGTPWWADLVASTLPSLGGDGTVDASFVPVGTPAYSWETSDPADQIRGQVAVQAAKRSAVLNPFPSENITTFYELFLTHFSDVDKQGHEYGVATKWNTDDTYKAAVVNKTTAIENIIAEIDSSTILIVTSDHGHVKFGGHGGSDSILRDIPLVFFQKNSTIATTVAAPANFKPEEAPRSGFQNKYSNLDVSATVCAILGLPSPRQSLGVFMEEAIDLFVPAGERLRHYHDLLVAKIRLVQAYKELMDSSFFAGQTPSVFSDSDAINSIVANSTFGVTGPYTERQYADMTRLVLADYDHLRTVRFNGVVYRNLVLSFLVIIPAVVSISTIFTQSAFLSIKAIFDSKHPLSSINRITCLCSFVTILLYVLFSILTYITLYYGVYDNDVWDSTATHTPSVAAQYLVAVIVGPVIFFTVLTKIPLAHTIYWHTTDAITEYKTVQKVRLFHIVRWIGKHAFTDVTTLIFATRSFKPHKYLWAHTYIHYLTAWVMITSLVLLFMSFPFSFLLPAIFSVEHVTALNQVYRFRVISVMFMMVPIQLACLLMLFLRPDVAPENMTLWDFTFLRGRLASDYYRLSNAKAKMSDRREKEAQASSHPPLRRKDAVNEANVSRDNDDVISTVDSIDPAMGGASSTYDKLQRISSSLVQVGTIASWLSDPAFRTLSVSVESRATMTKSAALSPRGGVTKKVDPVAATNPRRGSKGKDDTQPNGLGEDAVGTASETHVLDCDLPGTPTLLNGDAAVVATPAVGGGATPQ